MDELENIETTQDITIDSPSEVQPEYIYLIGEKMLLKLHIDNNFSRMNISEFRNTYRDQTLKEVDESTYNQIRNEWSQKEITL